MQRTRIRYRKVNDNTYVSTENLVSKTTGAVYKITITLDDMSFKIYNVNSERIVSRGSTQTRKGLNEKIRRKLKALGVELEQEIRNLNVLKGVIDEV